MDITLTWRQENIPLSSTLTKLCLLFDIKNWLRFSFHLSLFTLRYTFLDFKTWNTFFRIRICFFFNTSLFHWTHLLANNSIKVVDFDKILPSFRLRISVKVVIHLGFYNLNYCFRLWLSNEDKSTKLLWIQTELRPHFSIQILG